MAASQYDQGLEIQWLLAAFDAAARVTTGKDLHSLRRHALVVSRGAWCKNFGAVGAGPAEAAAPVQQLTQYEHLMYLVGDAWQLGRKARPGEVRRHLLDAGSRDLARSFCNLQKGRCGEAHPVPDLVARILAATGSKPELEPDGLDMSSSGNSNTLPSRRLQMRPSDETTVANSDEAEGTEVDSRGSEATEPEDQGYQSIEQQDGADELEAGKDLAKKADQAAGRG